MENQISSRPSITLFFNFAEIITGPIRFSLIFIGFFLTSKLTHTHSSFVLSNYVYFFSS